MTKFEGAQKFFQEFPAYSEYKDSGIDVLEEVPVEWKIKKLKWLVTHIGSGKTPKGGSEIYSESGVVFIRSQNVHFTGLRLDDVVYIDEEIDTEMASTRVLPEDVLLNITGASLGRCSVVPNDFPSANVNQHVCIIRPDQRYINPKFLNAAIASNIVQTQIFSGENGTSREGLTFSQIGNFHLVIPKSIEEQETIAHFLDQATAEIDHIIDQQQQLIALLEEERTTVISHAVTKGLDPSVPMKDSSVEWLGEIPQHWEVKRIKRLCQVKRGASPRPIDEPSYFDDEGEYAWVRISDVTASDRYLLETEQQLSELGKSKSIPLEPGEIFLSIAGSVGKPIITKIKCCIHDGFVYFSNLKEHREYWFHIFSSGQLYLGLGKLGTQLNLNTDTVGSIQIPVPSLDEQNEISIYIDQETAKIDQAIANVKEQIEKLEEYRTALISDAVTGKIDVRGWAA